MFIFVCIYVYMHAYTDIVPMRTSSSIIMHAYTACSGYIHGYTCMEVGVYGRLYLDVHLGHVLPISREKDQ